MPIDKLLFFGGEAFTMVLGLGLRGRGVANAGDPLGEIPHGSSLDLSTPGFSSI